MPVSEPATASPIEVTVRGEPDLLLLVDPGGFAELDSCRHVAAHARSQGVVRHLRTTWYDTGDGALHRSGITLRVRRSGKRFIQSLLIRWVNGVDMPRLREWEMPVPSLEPDITSLLPLVPADVRAILTNGSDALRPMFTTHVKRRLRTLVLPAASVEVAFDAGVIRAGDREVPISEIELQLRHGSAASVHEFAMRLGEVAAIRPSVRGTAERGFSLAFDHPPPARKAESARFDDEASADDVLAASLRSSLRHLLVNLAAAEDGRNIEGVHQIRVALRRSRSLLALLRAIAPSATLAAFQEDARWLAGCLGDARNWDVFITETLPAVDLACPSLGGFGVLRQAVAEHREAAYGSARQALADARSGRFQIAFGLWIEQRGWRRDASADGLAVLTAPATVFASQTLSRQLRKVVKRGRHFARLSVEERHGLRLAVKKLRYTADSLLPLFGDRKSVRAFAKGLSAVQDRLGRYNDMATTNALTTRLLDHAMPPSGHQALGAVIGWQAHATVGVEADLRRAVRGFAKIRPPWPDAKSPPPVSVEVAAK